MTASVIPAVLAARVARRIRADLVNLNRVAQLVREAMVDHPAEPAPHLLIIHGVGGLVHDFYTGIEGIFGLVAPDLNGYGPTGERWHRELLRTMVLDLPKVRPAVISSDSEQRLLEYLRFRHLYRNMYGFRLEWLRVRGLAGGIEALWTSVCAELETFACFLDAIVDAAAEVI